MKKFILMSLLLPMALMAQSQPNVYVTVWTNATGTSTFTAVPNIGATSHELLFKNTGTCLGTLEMLGGSDNVNFITFASVTVGAVQMYELRGNGLYPFVNIKFTKGAGTCSFSAWYTGSKTAIDPVLIQGQAEGTTAAASRFPLEQDSMLISHSLLTTQVGATEAIYTATNDSAAALLPDTTGNASASLHTIIVGTAGATSSLSISCAGTGTVMVVDTTVAKVIPVDLFLYTGTVQATHGPCTYTTTGGTPAKITFLIKQ